MANIDVDVGGRRYAVSCRDGEEDHLRSVAALVDKRARDAGQALGSLSEARTLLFAALMIADDLHEARSGGAAAPAPTPAPDLAGPLEQLAERVEALAQRLEKGAGKP